MGRPQYYVVKSIGGEIYLRYENGNLTPLNEIGLPNGFGNWRIERISRRKLEEVKTKTKELEGITR